MKTNLPSHLSDVELESEVKRLALDERETTVRLITHLAEFDARRLYLAAGFSSLFTYCTEVLRLSEHETYNRIEAARAARRFPVILDMLGEAALNLTTVRLLAPHLTADNHRELLATASGKSKREVEVLVARHFPRPAVPASVRRLPAARPIPMRASAPLGADTTTAPSLGGPTETAAPSQSLGSSVPLDAVVLPTLTRRPVETPLAPDRYEIRFTASAKTYEKLRIAQDLLRHAVPSGDPGEIVDRALTALLEDLAKKKFAATERPRASRGARGGSRRVPAAVKRAVWLRDGGRCAFAGKTGRRCKERGFLEFHHVQPYAAGGAASVDNMELRCRAHNAYEAELFYGLRKPIAGEGVVREPRTPYRDLGEKATRSGTSWARTLSH